MDLTIYKTRIVNGKTKATPEVDFTLNVNKIVLHTMSTIELFNIIDVEDLNMVLSFISKFTDKENDNKKEVVNMLVPIYTILKNHKDDILNFIYEVLIDNNYNITLDQLKTVSPSELVCLLLAIFRILGTEFGYTL